MSGSRPHLHHFGLRWTQPKFCVTIVHWRPPGQSADKLNVPREEALYAMSHAHAIFPNFQATRGGFNRSPTLFIGPSRYGTLDRHCYPTRRRAHLPRHGPTRVDPQKCRLRGRRPVMTNDPTIPTKAEIEDLAQWAEAGEFDPNFAGGKALHLSLIHISEPTR